MHHVMHINVRTKEYVAMKSIQDITEIVLKVALSTIKQTSNNIYHHPSRQYLDTDVVFQIYQSLKFIVA
jgi:hypothetical protein